MYTAHTPRDDCITTVLFSFRRAVGSVFVSFYDAPSLCDSRLFVLTYTQGAHLLALFALLLFTLPLEFTFQTLFAFARLALRRKQFCALQPTAHDCFSRL